MNTYCPKQADLIASTIAAHESGQSLDEPLQAFEAYLLESAETIPYILAARPTPEDVITYLSETDPDVEILSEQDFL